MEELGLDKKISKLLCIDYGKRDTETVTYLFYGGVLSQEEIDSIKIPLTELSEYLFVSIEEAQIILGSKVTRRLPFCIEALSNGKIIYLENGSKPEMARSV